jgi:hypothetical protein
MTEPGKMAGESRRIPSLYLIVEVTSDAALHIFQSIKSYNFLYLMPTSLHRPLSPSISETTTRASELDFDGKVITRADLRNSVQAYQQVLSTLARSSSTK